MRVSGRKVDYLAERSGAEVGRRSPRSTLSTCAIARRVISLGLAGVPGLDSPFSSFWYVYLLRFAS